MPFYSAKGPRHILWGLAIFFFVAAKIANGYVADSDCNTDASQCTGSFLLTEVNSLRCVTIYGNVTAEAYGATTIECMRVVVGIFSVLIDENYAYDGLVTERVELIVEGSLNVNGFLNLADTSLFVTGSLTLSGPRTTLVAETLDIMAEAHLHISSGAQMEIFDVTNINCSNFTVDSNGRAEFKKASINATAIQLSSGGVIRVLGNGFDPISDEFSHIQALSLWLVDGGSIAILSGAVQCSTLVIMDQSSCGLSCSTLISLDLSVLGARETSLVSHNGIVEVYGGDIHLKGSLIATNSQIETEGSIFIGGNEPDFSYIDTVASEVPVSEANVQVGGHSPFSVDLSNTNLIAGHPSGRLVVEGGGDGGVFRAHSSSYVSIAGDFILMGDAGTILDLSASVFEVLGQLNMTGSLAGRSSISISHGSRVASASHFVEVASLQFVNSEDFSNLGAGQAFVAQFLAKDRHEKHH